jgi:hypothetical protein
VSQSANLKQDFKAASKHNETNAERTDEKNGLVLVIAKDCGDDGAGLENECEVTGPSAVYFLELECRASSRESGMGGMREGRQQNYFTNLPHCAASQRHYEKILVTEKINFLVCSNERHTAGCRRDRPERKD